MEDAGSKQPVGQMSQSSITCCILLQHARNERFKLGIHKMAHLSIRRELDSLVIVADKRVQREPTTTVLQPYSQSYGSFQTFSHIPY